MTWIFWTAVLLVSYAYFGYPLWLWLRSHVRPWPVKRSPISPFISIVMVVRNEAAVLERKLQNLLSMHYPKDRRELVVISDGSTDETSSILAKFGGGPEVRIYQQEPPQGKAAGLRTAFTLIRGEIVIFTDARQQIEGEAVKFLVENFVDPEVGCASGELMLGDPQCGEVAKGTGLYWKIEKKIREMESASGSIVGATGALYAVRRSLLVCPPPETILDDVYIPMHVVRQSARAVWDERARAWDVPSLGIEREFSRKVRTLNGNYQLMRLAPWLLSSENPLRFEFVSHKLLRLLVPFAMAAALLSTCFLTGRFYRVALLMQGGFYALGLWGWLFPSRGPLSRVADAALTFVMLNAAALVAFKLFLGGRKAVWNR